LMRARPISTLFPYTTLFRSPRRLASRERPQAVDEGQHFLGGGEGGMGGRRNAVDIHEHSTGAGDLRSDLGCRQNAPMAGFGSLRDRKSTRLNSSHVKISYAV